MLPYDSTRLLLMIRENGINEGDTNNSQADKDLAAAYPDSSLIWIDAATGKSLGLAHVFGIHPITITGQASQNDFFHEWGIDQDVEGNRALYMGHKNKILRWAPKAGGGWESAPTCAWTEPTTGAQDCSGTDLDGSTGGDGNQSIRWREMRVTGAGTNTAILAGGGTWRAGCQPQVFKTTDGVNFRPDVRVDDRNNGAAQNVYALGGQISHIVKHGLDSTRPNLVTSYSGHYPGSGYGARPNRYQTDPDQPAVTLAHPYAFESSGEVAVMTQDDVATNGIPAFVWEAAGKDGLPQVVTVDGVDYYDGNWSCTMDANAEVDYIVNYSLPSWNTQDGGVYGNVNLAKPGWIGVHRLDGSISPNSAWKLPCTELDAATPDESPGTEPIVGNAWGYCGDISIFPDTNAPANLKKATFYWVGGAYGFGIFTVQNVAASLTTEPQDITAIENNPLTIEAAVTGSPNSYQWSKDGVVLDGTKTNADGSLRYPPSVVQGVKKAKLYLPAALISDSGSYTLSITNPLGNLTTRQVNVLVTSDTNKPTVTSVSGLGTPNPSGGPSPFAVKVVFSKRVDPTTAADATHYTITPTVAVSSATLLADGQAASLGGDWREVILSTAGLTPGQQYTLAVSGVKDQTTAGNVMAPTSISFAAPTRTPGIVNWDYYYPVTGGLDGMLGSDAYARGASMTNATLSVLDTTPITGGDLNNNPAFGALGDGYGSVVSGWITPTVSTNYIFYLASDDGSRLLLSTDENAAGATMVVEEPTCCHPFTDANPLVSAPIALVAGKSYYFQALQVEGAGGDYVQVGWRMEGDTNVPSGPISSAYLSGYGSAAQPKFDSAVLSGGQLTISWTGSGTLQESLNFQDWTDVTPAPSSPYVVTPTGPGKFYRIKQ
jgi:hypothetical protein